MKQYESVETSGSVTLKRQIPQEDRRPPSWPCELLKLSPLCAQESTPSQRMFLSGLLSGFVRDWCLGACLLPPVAQSAGSSSHRCALCLCSHCSFALISSLSPCNHTKLTEDTNSLKLPEDSLTSPISPYLTLLDLGGKPSPCAVCAITPQCVSVTVYTLL